MSKCNGSCVICALKRNKLNQFNHHGRLILWVLFRSAANTCIVFVQWSQSSKLQKDRSCDIWEKHGKILPTNVIRTMISTSHFVWLLWLFNVKIGDIFKCLFLPLWNGTRASTTHWIVNSQLKWKHIYTNRLCWLDCCRDSCMCYWDYCRSHEHDSWAYCCHCCYWSLLSTMNQCNFHCWIHGTAVYSQCDWGNWKNSAWFTRGSGISYVVYTPKMQAMTTCKSS